MSEPEVKKRRRKVRHPNEDDLRKLKYRIGIIEDDFKKGVEKLHEIVIKQNNTVYIGLPTDINNILATLMHLSGLRRAAECMEGRTGF
jgi:hypothetical protein